MEILVYKFDGTQRLIYVKEAFKVLCSNPDYCTTCQLKEALTQMLVEEVAIRLCWREKDISLITTYFEPDCTLYENKGEA